MIKLDHKKTVEILISMAAISATFWLDYHANAYTVSFQGGITIDFGVVSVPPTINIGQQTITIDDTIDLPFTREQLLLSLADGDSSIPIESLLSGFFPQKLEVDSQLIRLNNIDISTFTGSGSASSNLGFLSPFNFEYIPLDPVLGVPTVELKGFNPNFSQCVDIKCQYEVTSSSLTASFDATLINAVPTTDLFIANTDFTINLSNAPATASLSAATVPESTSWFVLPIILGGFTLHQFFYKYKG